MALSGSIFIAPGNTTGLIDVAVIDDATVEATETVNIELFSFSTFTGASLGTAKASLNIVDNDKATYSINSITVNENVGTATLTVSLSNPVDISTTVDVKYADVTATGGGLDYDSTTDTVVFAAGKVAPQTVTVSIVDDSLTETLDPGGLTEEGTSDELGTELLVVSGAAKRISSTPSATNSSHSRNVLTIFKTSWPFCFSSVAQNYRVAAF